MKDAEFEAVYRDYFHDVFLYLRSISRDAGMAEELTQEVFFKALRSLEKFRGDCDVRVWLCQIARHEYISYCRKMGRLDFVDIESDPDREKPPAGSVRFEERLEDSADALDIHKILHTLDEPYKEVFSLRVFSELSFRQIAEVFGKTESWARVTYHRARLKIRERLESRQGGQIS